MPRLPVTRNDTAWPPATAVRGADAATMKNTMSGTPSARRCSFAVSRVASAGKTSLDPPTDMEPLLFSVTGRRRSRRECIQYTSARRAAVRVPKPRSLTAVAGCKPVDTLSTC